MNTLLKSLLQNGKRTLLVLDQDGTLNEARWNTKNNSRNIIDDWNKTGNFYMTIPLIPQTLRLVDCAAQNNIAACILTASNAEEIKKKKEAFRKRPELQVFGERLIWVDEKNTLSLKAVELSKMAQDYEQLIYIDDNQEYLYRLQELVPENVWLFHLSSILV